MTIKGLLVQKERVTRYVARLLHDAVAHPLIAISDGASWSHRFHDWIGVVWASPDPTRSLVIRGSSPYVEAAAIALESAGYRVIDAMHDVAHVVPPRDRDVAIVMSPYVDKDTHS